MLPDKVLTYISLFSCAGVGCYGFKQAGFLCIATNELIERRLNVQKFNKKCPFDSGYIHDDITKEETRERIFGEIKRWEKEGNDKVDVLIATPPCQGMSVANHKKTDHEITRNSLVVESIQLVQKIKPRFFIFENVAAFLKTGCTSPDGTVKSIGQVILEELSEHYVIAARILNFKDYGSNSSRTRTLIIGVEKELGDYISPIELYPNYQPGKMLRQVIGQMPKLQWGEINSEDFYHGFRTYPKEMRSWIHCLKEGECAFDNRDEKKRPHKIVDGKIVFNQRKNGDKYTRQYWDRIAPCIHTRNDLLASQNTIHPEEDRVFSIRELMEIMTIPKEFKWMEQELSQLNKISKAEKAKLLKIEEMKIRQSIGEAVPTSIFRQVAEHIKTFMEKEHLSYSSIKKVIEEEKLEKKQNLVRYIKNNAVNLCNASLARIAELANSKRESNSAYYTNKFIVNEIFRELPEFEKEELHILEPSVGVGSFLPFIFRKYETIPRVFLDVVDIDRENLVTLRLLLEKMDIPENFQIRYIEDDFLTHEFDVACYDLVIGNPPFTKMKRKDADRYLKNNINQDTTNLFEFFLEKALGISEYVVMITPKALLNTGEFALTRKLLEKKKVMCIEDFGEQGFKGVLVETICLFIQSTGNPARTKVHSLPLSRIMVQKQSYIMDSQFPYWIIYRDEFFDDICGKMEFGRFQVFRDRQITNSNTATKQEDHMVRVLRSRNISDTGDRILDIPGYDCYMDSQTLKSFAVSRFLNQEDVYLTPNMTYKPRVIPNIPNTVGNGSVAVLIPKEPIKLSKQQLAYFSSAEYRKFYKIARNYQTRSLNVDATSVFFYGVLKEEG